MVGIAGSASKRIQGHRLPFGPSSLQRLEDWVISEGKRGKGMVVDLKEWEDKDMMHRNVRFYSIQ